MSGSDNGVTSSQVNIVTNDNSKSTFWRNPRYPQYIAVLAVTIGAFSLGNVFGWSSPALPSILESEHFHNLTAVDQSYVGSLITIGAVPGSYLAGYCMGRIGRKNTLILCAIPLTLGWLILATAVQISMLFFGRFFTGFGNGALLTSAPIYLSEILEPDVRGRLGSVFFISAKVGILFTFVVGAYLPYNHLSAVCTPIPIIFALAVAFLPDSPRYLLSGGNTKGATDALCWFRGTRSSHPSEEITQEISEMLNEINKKKEENVKFFHLLISKPFLIVLGLMFFNQFCGGNYFAFYTVMIFEQTGSGLEAHLSAILVAFFLTIATIGTTFFVDSVGRRRLLLLAFMVMLLSLGLLGGFFLLKERNLLTNEGYKWIPLVALVIYNSAYNSGVSGLVWTVSSEILPGNVIGSASGLASTFNWIMAFVTTRYFVEVNNALGQEYVFWLFALFCGVGSIFIYVSVPETKLKSLTKIQQDNFTRTEQC